MFVDGFLVKVILPEQTSSLSVPWAVLGGPDRSSIGLIPHPALESFSSLSPASMNYVDVTRLYSAILEAQKKNDYIVKFTPSGATDDDGIVEIPDQDLQVSPKGK
ncbi:hypothetical protein H0H93_004398, partial [Arthromyces matolae]